MHHNTTTFWRMLICTIIVGAVYQNCLNAQPKIVATIECEKVCTYSVQFIDKSNAILTAGVDGKIKQWEVMSGKKIAEIGNMNGIASMAISANEQQILASGDGSEVCLFEKDKDDVQFRYVKTFKGHLPLVSINSSAIVNNGQSFVTADLSSVRFWFGSSGISFGKHFDEKPIVVGVQPTSDKNNINSPPVFVVDSKGDLYTITPRDRDVKKSSTTLGQGVRCMAFNKQGDRLGVGTDDGSIVYFDTCNEKVLSRFVIHKKKITSLVIGPGERWLAAGTSDGVLSILNVKNGKLIWSRELSKFSINSIAGSINGDLLAIASGKNVYLIDITHLGKQ